MRRILMVPEGTVNDYLKMAEDNDAPEIIEGIPSYLSSEYKISDLPVVHTEDDEVAPRSELEILQKKYDILQGAIDFLIMDV